MTRADTVHSFQYRSLDLAGLWERYVAVVEELANLEEEVAMIRGQERQVKLNTWLDLVNRGVSQREADKRADAAALDMTTEYWTLTASINSGVLEKELLEKTMHRRRVEDFLRQLERGEDAGSP